MIGRSDETVIQFTCGPTDLNYVRGQLQAHFPEAVVKPTTRSLPNVWHSLDSAQLAVIEFGLSREFVLPLLIGENDLLIGLAGTLEELEEGELGILQVLFEPIRHPWAASVLRAVATPDGESMFDGPIDMLEHARAKIASPLFSAVIRVACRAKHLDRARSLARRLGHGLDALANPMGNELIALDNKGYDPADHAIDVPNRRCRRSGMILNLAELSALVHLPTADVQSAKLKRRGQRTKPAPACVLHHELILGENEHAGRSREVTLGIEQRVRHMHVVGASGTGKSSFLLNLILQDIARGQGLAVLDPHGDLIDAILDRVPEHRISDVVLFDPADEDHPIGFNVLAAHSETEKTLISSDLVGIFRRLSTSWGDQMNAVLANAILSFLESDRGGTLADLRRFLVERSFREEFLQSVRDPHIVYYWRKEFPLQVGRSQGSVLTRLDTFLRPKSLRHIVAQRENRLDFADIMDSGKIFLARLAHGAIGEENTYLLGSLLVSKFHQIAIGRQQVKEEKRRHFWLYIDEFHHFATPSMASLLAGVRKYRLGLVLAHQEMHQLESRNPEVASAILSNSYTRVCFRVGDHDARKLKEGFSSFDAGDLQNLGTGEAVCRVERSEFEFNLRTTPLDRIQDAEAAARLRERIVAQSRERYATDRTKVEAELRESAESFVIEYPPSRSKKASSKTECASPEIIAPVVPDAKPSAPSPFSPEIISPHPAAVPVPPPIAEPKAKPIRVPAEEMQLGRGGPEHKYLQQLIKQWAEGHGYRGSIEGAISGSKGSVDVGLEKPNRKIGCLISITTSGDWELGSVQKCLAGQFQIVAVIAPNRKHLKNLQEMIVLALPESDRKRVHFFEPEAFFAYLQEFELKDLEQEKTVKGYRVKASYRPPNADDAADRRAALSKIVATSIQRGKKRRPEQ